MLLTLSRESNRTYTFTKLCKVSLFPEQETVMVELIDSMWIASSYLATDTKGDPAQ